MARFHVIVQIDKKHVEAIGTIPTIEVNLVGINESEYPQWESYSVDQYWSADDKMRKGADRFVFEFGQSRKIRQTLSQDGSAWDVWEEKTARYLLIIADIPGVHDPKKGKDGRYVVLPLNPENWSDDTLTITVKAGGITVTPAPELK